MFKNTRKMFEILVDDKSRPRKAIRTLNCKNQQ